MNRLGTLIAYSLVLCCNGCTKPLVPMEQTAVFPAEQAANLIRTVCYSQPVVTGFWTPEAKDLEGVEDKLPAYVDSKKVDEKKNWKDYRRQVVGVKRGNDKLLFIYYFSFPRSMDEALKGLKPGYDPDLWKKAPIRIFDGGSSCFRVLYDMKTKRFTWYECNGVT